MNVGECAGVEDFMKAWFRAGRPLKPPFKNAIHTTEIAYSLCLYRQKPFQVELYIMKAGVETPFHSHPGVNQITVYLTGDCDFGREPGSFFSTAAYQKESEDGTHFLFGKAMEALNDSGHAIRTNKDGGAFLVFEDWKDKDPTSVAVEWEGETVGQEHDRLRGKYHAVE